MTEHADTIRHVFSLPFISVDERDEALRSLDALLAENQKWKECYEAAADSCDATAEDLNAARAENQRLNDDLTYQQERRGEALAENQRLRDALERIRDEVPHYEPTDRICPSCMAEVALAGDGE